MATTVTSWVVLVFIVLDLLCVGIAVFALSSSITQRR
jgi:hypothetical protein